MNIQPGTSDARRSEEIGRKAQRKARHFSEIPAISGMEDMEISLAQDGANTVLVVRIKGDLYKATLTRI